MAYNSSNLVPFPGGYTVSPSVPPIGNATWKYTTTDSSSTVLTSGYISVIEPRLRNNDWIAVEASDLSLWTVVTSASLYSSGVNIAAITSP